jgi:hypothetical protein
MGAAEAVCFVEGSRGNVDVEDGDVNCSGHFVVLLAVVAIVKTMRSIFIYSLLGKNSYTAENSYIKSIG